MPLSLAIMFYRLGIKLYTFGIQIASFTNLKAQQWIKGREDLLERIRKKQHKSPECIWFHCASLGEFEQGRPLIELFRKEFPKQRIILTFFSPSGYNQRKNYSEVDEVYYLPIDSPSNAEEFIAAIRPKMVFFVKYEFWYFYFAELQRKGIPLYMLSSVFTTAQPFFKWYGTVHREMLKSVTHFFVQEETSANLLLKLGFTNASVINDTRIDRVYHQAEAHLQIPSVESFLNGESAFIGGSVYAKENQMIYDAYFKGILSGKIILVPHHVDGANIRNISKLWGDKAILYTEWLQKPDPQKSVLIINTVGLLSAMYRYGNVAYIGGGFSGGIHNTLEPASYALPIIVGPKHFKFPEVKAMINGGGAFEVTTTEDFLKIVQKLADVQFRIQAGENNGEFILKNTGGTLKVFDAVKDKI